MSSKYRFGEDNIPHFITCTVVEWIDALTRPAYKDIIVDSLKFCIARKGMILHAWVIMTNHLHLIMQAGEGHGIGPIVRDFKKFTSSQLLKAIESSPGESRKTWMLKMFRNLGARNSSNEVYPFWQRDSHPIELSRNEMPDQRLLYLHDNPVRAGIVYNSWDYIYSSARDYCTNRKGLIGISHLS